MAQQRNLGPNRLVLLGTRGGPRITEYKQTRRKPHRLEQRRLT